MGNFGNRLLKIYTYPILIKHCTLLSAGTLATYFLASILF